MTSTRLRISIFFVLGALWCASAGPAPAAPLHPDLRERLSPEQLAALPAEPARPAAAPMAGVYRAATREGRTWTGHPRILVLLADFDDRPADRETHDAAYYEQLLFSRDEMEFGSLRDYYGEVSYGALDVTGAVHGWFRMPRDYAVYCSGASGLCRTCYQANARYLAADALEAAIDAGIDITDFDNDGPDGVPDSGDDDGIIDGLLVVFSGIGAERTGSVDDIRSHYWDLVSTTTVGGVSVPDYACFPENENMGVPVHEFGHLLGAEDLYDLSNQGAGLGYFSVMATGMWTNNARSPIGPDPYTRALWGLVNPQVIYADEPGWELPRIDREPAVLRLWTLGEAGPEYFLVENRAAVGVDRFLPGEGLVVYHVDETVPRQDNPSAYRVSVVQADGLQSLEGRPPRNMGEPGDFFPGSRDMRALDDDTEPSTRAHDGSETLVALREISDPGERMTVSVEVGVDVGGAPDPMLEVVAGEGYFEPLPGTDAPFGIALRNRGARLGPGELRLFCRDPRVTGFEERVVDLPGLAPLGMYHPSESVTVRLRPGVDESRAPVFLEGEVTSGGGTWLVSAPLPTEGTVIAREGFESETAAATSETLRPDGPDPWRRLTGHSSEGKWAFGTNAGAESYAGYTDAALVLGPYMLEGPAELRFRHMISTQTYGEYAQDGGYLEASGDGGSTWTRLDPVGGYPVVFDYTAGNPYPGEPAWGGDEGWREVRVPVVGFRGETLFRFHFVSDNTGAGYLYRGWFVDEVLLRGWERCYTAVFSSPGRDGSGLRVGFSVLSLLDEGPETGVALMREHGDRRTEIGRWPVSGRLDVSVAVEEVPEGWTDRFWLEWDDGREPSGPLLVDAPGGPPPSLLSGTAGVMHLSAPGIIRYRVPGTGPAPVVLNLYDVRGALVARLVDASLPAGSHEFAWSGRTGAGRAAASGVYFLRLRAAGAAETRRIVLLP